MLLMTSYLVTIATDSHQTCVKMCLRDMHTTTKNDRSRQQIVIKKFKKNLMGVGHVTTIIIPVSYYIQLDISDYRN